MRLAQPGPDQLCLALAGVPEVVVPQQRRLRSVKPPASPPQSARHPALPPHPRSAASRPTARPEQQRGDLHGAAPTSRQVTTITLRVEQLPGGHWRFTQPRVPAWAAVASGPGQAIAAIRNAFVEAQVAAYSDWRNHVYDGAVTLADHGRRRAKRSKPNPLRKDTHPPTAWLLAPDGRWRSPKGLLFEESCQVVQRVMERRRRLGMSPRPDPADPGDIERQSA